MFFRPGAGNWICRGSRVIERWRVVKGKMRWGKDATVVGLILAGDLGRVVRGLDRGEKVNR